VFIQRLCRAFVLGVVLFGGSILGMPMRPEEIENLMSTMNQIKVEMTIPDKGGNRKGSMEIV
jgi:hypothetical protein